MVIKKLFLTFLFLFLILPTYSQESELAVKEYNINRNESILIISNIEDKTTNEKIINYLDENKNRIPFKITFVELKDNIYSGDYSGSKYYLDNELLEVPRIAFYFDISKDIKPEFYAFNNRYLPDLRITKSVISNLNFEDRVKRLFPLYLTGVYKNPGILREYQKWGVSMILFNGDINVNSVLDSIRMDDVPGEKQNLYYIFSLFNGIVYLNAVAILLIFSIFFLLIILLTTFFFKRISFHMRHNSKFLITLPLKVISVFIFYFIATLIIDYINTLSGDNRFLYNFPVSLFIIKNMILYFIYGIFFHIIKDAPFSKSPHFYSFISFFVSIGICIYLSLIYLPLGLFQIWPIMMTIFFMSSKERSTKRFFWILSPLVLIIFLGKYLNGEHKDFIHLFITSKYKGNILLTMFSAPYLFLQDSYHRFITRRHNRIVYQKDIILSILLLTSTITYIAILLEL